MPAMPALLLSSRSSSDSLSLSDDMLWSGVSSDPYGKSLDELSSATLEALSSEPSSRFVSSFKSFLESSTLSLVRNLSRRDSMASPEAVASDEELR